MTLNTNMKKQYITDITYIYIYTYFINRTIIKKRTKKKPQLIFFLFFYIVYRVDSTLKLDI